MEPLKHSMGSKPGLLFVLNSLEIGGSETKIIRVANALGKAGINVSLAHLDPVETARQRVDPIVPVFCLDRHGKYSIKALRRLHDLVHHERQVVVAVNLYPLLYVIPLVSWRRSASVKAVGLINTSELVGKEKVLGGLYARFLKRCDRLVFGCEAQRTFWLKQYRLAEEKSDVIYNGVDHEVYSPSCWIEAGTQLRREYGIPADAIVIGSVGRLDPEKSIDLMLRALGKLNAGGRETYAIHVGQGRERDSLERTAKEEGVLERVRFLGLLNDVRPALSAMDIFVLPSSAVETFSNAALEAMAMARPVVLSSIGGASEMVVHRESGMIFPVGDICAFTEILSHLHDSSDLRSQLGKAARERVVCTFAFSTMVDRYRAMLSLV